MARTPKILRKLSQILCLIFITYFVTHYEGSSRTKNLSRYITDIKHLLIWTRIPGVNSSGQTHFVKKKCTKYNCYFTTNRSLFGDLRYFDGIVFNLQDVSKNMVFKDLPKVRSWKQKYIFAANDSADTYPICDPVFDDFFNWTWTYRSDSTIPYRFISIYNLHNENLGHDFNWHKMKPLPIAKKTELTSKFKAAAIFLDNCKSRSKREIFIRDLQTHLRKYNMTIDVFGKCGTMDCRRKTIKPCLWKLKKQYFFYLALEDSLSEDFVTKNVLYAYKSNAVPIVYGKAEYDRFLPPHSYLDGLVLGPEKLALTMYQIAFDPSRYHEYFSWKNHYTIREGEVLDACSLCSALNNPHWLNHDISFTQFRKWWNPDYERRCREH